MADTLGTVQPFRYRGYVYDEETGLYYLRSRYYAANLCRFINADSVLSDQNSFCYCSGYSYCLNRPTTQKDSGGCETCSAIDANSDGDIDYYVYTFTYTYEKAHLQPMWSINSYSTHAGPASNYVSTTKHTGCVYLYYGVDKDFFEDPSNMPEGFDPSCDIMIGDYLDQSNPNLYAFQAQKLDITCRSGVLDVMETYVANRGKTQEWGRSRSSLELEWRVHDFFSVAKRCQDIDFDRNEEGYTWGDYFHKIWREITK